MNQQTLLSSSMKMISFSGEAQDKIQRCLELIQKSDYNCAIEYLEEAGDQLRNAHIEQTHILQKVMEEETEESSRFLFSHAQDTLMTINSEYIIAKQMLALYKTLDQRICILEGKYEND